jgi:hypothetical protein
VHRIGDTGPTPSRERLLRHRGPLQRDLLLVAPPLLHGAMGGAGSVGASCPDCYPTAATSKGQNSTSCCGSGATTYDNFRFKTSASFRACALEFGRIIECASLSISGRIGPPTRHRKPIGRRMCKLYSETKLPRNECCVMKHGGDSLDQAVTKGVWSPVCPPPLV